MNSRKICTTFGVAVLGSFLVAVPQATAALVESTQQLDELSQIAVPYAKLRTPEEAQRILDERSNGFQPYALKVPTCSK